MVISKHLTTFGGKPVVQYTAGASFDPATHAIKLTKTYDDEEDLTSATLQALVADPRSEQITALVIGAWDGALEQGGSGEFVEALCVAAPRLPSLDALFLGEMVYQECEISWINQGDVSPIWEAFPNLKTFAIRGSNGLSLGKIEHGALQSLTIECGGLPKNVLKELANATLPALSRLELYLGTENYGWDGSIRSVKPLLKDGMFPNLKHLGLRDSEIADQVAVAVAASPILAQLETLDLSLGTLGDKGAKALLASDGIKTLKKLDLHYHFISDEVQEALKALPIEVDLSDPKDEEEFDGDRYVSVGE